MENKIYGAIQKGLSNVLIFDNNDSSISYQKTDINNTNTGPIISLDELYDIFKDGVEDIFSYNTEDCIILILDNGEEIPLYKYKKSSNPVFLKIFNKKMKSTGNEIIIACDNDHYISLNKKRWQMESKQILPTKYLISNKHVGEANIDFNGYLKTQMIIDITNNDPELGDIPAINYCNSIKSPLLNYKGYLPSIGQLIFIMKYLDIINYIFEYIGADTLKLLHTDLWSSSENDASYAWFLTVWNYTNYNYGLGLKEAYSFTVFPLFRRL